MIRRLPICGYGIHLICFSFNLINCQAELLDNRVNAMSLSFNLQRLPPEAISVLRFLGNRGAAASSHDMESGLDIGARAVGRAIRRLVNYSLIQMDFNGAYQLTTDGRRAYQQLADKEVRSASSTPAARSVSQITRRLTIVLPHVASDAQPVTLFIGVNPANNTAPHLADSAQVELRLSVIGGTLSQASLSLEVPPAQAAAPVAVTVTAQPNVRTVRIRIDAFQVIDTDRVDPVGDMYFDIPVRPVANTGDSTRRAVGTDLALI